MPSITHDTAINLNLAGPILTQRIPCWPYADPKGRHVVLYDEYVKTGGYEGLRKALALRPDAVTDEVKKSALRGRGGAGFPTGLKWTFLPKVTTAAESLEAGHESDPGQRYLAVNADESEPGTFKDRLLMDFDPHLMLEGIAIACYACRIKTAYIFIRGEYHHQAHVVENAIKEAYAHGIFGTSAHGTSALRADSSSLLGSSRETTPRAALSRSSVIFIVALVPISAAKRRGCSRRSRASAAGLASSRRSPRSKACSASRRSSTTSRRWPTCRASSLTARTGL